MGSFWPKSQNCEPWKKQFFKFLHVCFSCASMALSELYKEIASSKERKAFETAVQDFGHERNLFATSRGIIERGKGKSLQVLVQTRWKYSDARHSGFLEIPGGHIKLGETVFDALKREVKEETGLSITSIYPNKKVSVKGNDSDEGIAFVPFCGQTFKGSSRIGFVFLAKAKGKLIPKGVRDAKESHWVSFKELKELVKKKKFWSYDLAALKYYIQEKEKRRV